MHEPTIGDPSPPQIVSFPLFGDLCIGESISGVFEIFVFVGDGNFSPGDRNCSAGLAVIGIVEEFWVSLTSIFDSTLC